MSKQTRSSKRNGKSKNARKGTPSNWMHAPEALQTGHVTYLVKFIGKTVARKPKGIEVVKGCIRNLKTMNQQKLSKGGEIPKVELAISINDVAVQDEETKEISYQYPLHQISYCADDKPGKKLISFIAKEPGSNKHSCFVFESDEMAEEIALTIGQAFDLAYRNFFKSCGKDLGNQRGDNFFQKKVEKLEAENREIYDKLVGLEDRRITNNSTIINMVNGVLVTQSLRLARNDEVVQPIPAPPRPRRRAARNVLPQNSLGEGAERPNAKSCYNEFLSDLKEIEKLFNENAATGGADEPGDFNISNDIAEALFDIDPVGMGAYGPLSEDEDEQVAVEGTQQLLEKRDGFTRGISFGHGELSAVYYG